MTRRRYIRLSEDDAALIHDALGHLRQKFVLHSANKRGDEFGASIYARAVELQRVVGFLRWEVDRGPRDPARDPLLGLVEPKNATTDAALARRRAWLAADLAKIRTEED